MWQTHFFIFKYHFIHVLSSSVIKITQDESKRKSDNIDASLILLAFTQLLIGYCEYIHVYIYILRMHYVYTHTHVQSADNDLK